MVRPPIRQILCARRHGIVNPLIAWQESRRQGIGFPLACAILEQESGGGWNIFGHDPTIYAGAGRVTRHKYLAYKTERIISGDRLMQGVGPLQLTWWSTQDEADREGGCWRPRINMRIGFRTLAGNIRRYGHWQGIRAYNGSGPNAVRYAWQVTRREQEWVRRLG